MNFNGKRWTFLSEGQQGGVFGHNGEILKQYHRENSATKEVEILKKIKNLHFVPKLIRQYNNKHFTMTRVPGVQLDSLRGKLNRNSSQQSNISNQLLNHIKKLENKGITHGDLHHRNILVDMSSGKPKVYIIDFGDSTYSNGKVINTNSRNFINNFRTSTGFLQPKRTLNNNQNAQNNLGKVITALRSWFPPKASFQEKRNLKNFLHRFRNIKNKNKTNLLSRVNKLGNGNLPAELKEISKKNYHPPSKRSRTSR
jgi:RIO-like serine/threonine protein kinase